MGSETQECQVWIARGHLVVMSKCPFPLPGLSTGTSGDRNQSDVTDADIRWRIHLQLVSPELPLTAGALRYAAMPLQDSSISPASWRCSAVTKHSQMTLSIVLLFQVWRGWWETRWQKHIFSSQDLVRILPTLWEFGAQWLCKTSRRISDSKESEQGLWSCCWGYLDFKVILLIHILPLFFIIQGL